MKNLFVLLVVILFGVRCDAAQKYGNVSSVGSAVLSATSPADARAAIGVEFVSVADKGAVADGVWADDVITTSGTNIVTTQSARFSAGDVGKSGFVYSGSMQIAVSITSVSSSTSVILSTTIPLSGTATLSVGTDNASAIQAAIDTASSAKGTGNVYIPSGNYRISSPLTIYRDGTRFIGAGFSRSRIIVTGTVTHGIMCPVTHYNPAGNTWINNSHYSTFEDFELCGPGLFAGSGDGFHFEKTAEDGAIGHITINRVSVRGFRHGYHGNYVVTGLIENSMFLNNVVSIWAKNCDSHIYKNCWTGYTNMAAGTECFYINGGLQPMIFGGEHGNCDALADISAATSAWYGGNIESINRPYLIKAVGGDFLWESSMIAVQSGNASAVLVRSEQCSVSLRNLRRNGFASPSQLDVWTGGYKQFPQDGMVVREYPNNTFTTPSVTYTVGVIPQVNAWASGTQTLANGQTTIICGSEENDTTSSFSVTTGKYTAPVTGKYKITASATCSLPDGTYASLDVYKNMGSGSVRHLDKRYSSAAGQNVPLFGCVDYDLIAGDIIELTIYQASGTSQTTTSGATTWLNIVKIL